MKTTTTTPATSAASTAFDPRSPYMLGLDEATKRLAKLLPDRVPEGVPLQLLAVPSTLSSWATELAERTARRHGGSRAYRDTALRSNLERLPALLRSAELTDTHIRRMLDAIEGELEDLESPPDLPAPLDHWVDLGRDLGVDLGAERKEGLRRLMAAIFAANTGDRRAALVWRALIEFGDNREEDTPSALARRARHALSGFGFPPVRADDASYIATRAELAPPLPPRLRFNWRQNTSPPLWLVGIASEAGAPFPPMRSADQNLRRDEAAELQQLISKARRGVLAPPAAISEWGSDTANMTALQEERKALEARSKEARMTEDDRRSLEIEAVRTTLLDAIEGALGALESTEAGSLRCWWLRELRRFVATADAGDQVVWDVTVGVQRLPAWEHVKSLGVAIVVPASASSRGAS